MDFNPFKHEGKWFKGNLHCHSTNSDGRLSPSEVAAIYKSRGWNFLAFTDHRLYTDNSDLNDENFLIIPGAELDVSNPDPFRIYHIVGIARTEPTNVKDGYKHMDKVPCPQWTGLQSAQAIIDDLNAKNNLAIFCHPNWSRLELDDFKDLNGFFAMELFNYGCALESNTGLSVDYWDSLLRRGRKVWGVATDDAHHALHDECGGWVMVNAPELTYEAIAEALELGSFYSSTGPEIYKYKVEQGEVHVECSPVRAIHFVTYENWGYSCWAPDEGSITSASYKLNGKEKYVRVECVDSSGRTAWSNPVFLK